MNLSPLYVSRPGVAFPDARVDNAEIIRRVHANYRGPSEEWPAIESGIEKVFALCSTETRYLEPSLDARVADYAARAARKCLVENDATLDEVDLVICGSIPRQYFEPATAMEICANLGIKRTHAFDVTEACVGHLEAIHAAAAYMTLHPNYRTALVCTAELTYDYLSYDIQSVRELRTKSAGLTVGNAAACVLLQRQPFARGGLRILGLETYTEPHHWELCQVPIGGTFSSSSVELMRLGQLIPPVMKRNLEALGLTAKDIDHFVFHQPSEIMVRKILEDIGSTPDRGIYTHRLYGNTASASVGVTYHQLLLERDVRPNDKIVLGSAAAGFSAVQLTGEWTAAPK